MNKALQITGLATKASFGWFKPAHQFSVRAHVFKRAYSSPNGSGGTSHAWKAICGVEVFSTQQAPMFEAGNWTRCKKCEQQLARRNAA